VKANLLAPALLLATACVAFEGEIEGEGEGEPPAVGGFVAGDIVGVRAEPGERPTGTYMVFDETDEAPANIGEPVASARLQATGRVLYMNRHGGTFYRAGYNDSRTNESIVPKSDSTIEPWDIDEHGWAEVMSCVRGQFSRWDIVVTDEDPGEVPHFESVVAGRPEDLGLAKGIGGISPFTSTCSTVENSIVFTFAEVFGDNNQVVCEVVAQEVAHSFGLDHEFLCEDPMTYLGGCGAKSFQPVWAPCGEGSERPCACGEATQNSVAMLDARIGISGSSGGPGLMVTSPVDGGEVLPGFAVRAIASSDDRVEVVVSIDGVEIGRDKKAPYEIETDPGLALGEHTVEVVAIDEAGKRTVETLSVTVDPDAESPASGVAHPETPLEDILGGCRVGSGDGGAGAWLLLALATLLARRRRRGAARSRHSAQ
jgi:MYXO-CTERM domain-containing protein